MVGWLGHTNAGHAGHGSLAECMAQPTGEEKERRFFWVDVRMTGCGVDSRNSIGSLWFADR